MRRRIIVLLLCVFIGRNVLAEEPSVKTETRAIGPWKYQAPSQGAGRFLPDISLIGNFAGAYYSDEPAEAPEGDPEKTGFNLTEIEMAIQSVIDPYFKGDIFLAFSTEGVEIEEAYVTTLSLPKGFQIRAGKFKLPFGRQNQKHTHLWAYVDNPLVNAALFGGEGLNEVGIEASYLFPTSFFLQLQTNVTNGDNEDILDANSKTAFLYQTRLSTSFDMTPSTTLLLGTSGAWGNNNSGKSQLTRLYGGDVFLKWKPESYRSLSWQTEYIYRKMDTPSFTNDDHGFYSYIDYQFLKRWHAVFRYDQVGFQSESVEREFKLVPAITFTPTEFALLRLQYDYSKKVNVDPVHAVFLQLLFSMGPHGAHNF